MALVGAWGVKYGLILLVFFTLFLFHIHIQPLQGWEPSPALPQVFLKLFKFNPYRG